MSLLDRVAGALGLRDIDYPEVPSDAVELTGKELAEAFHRGGSKTWNGYRLISIGDDFVYPREGQWPRIVETSYLEMGEGDEPTVYLTELGSEGDYPIGLEEYVVLARNV